MRKAGWGAMIFFLACGGAQADDAVVRLDPSLLFPHGILDSVTTLTLRAYDSTLVTCNAERGVPEGDTSALYLEQELGTDSCPGGARFCGDVTLRRSSSAYVFVASAEDSRGRLIASGCEPLLVDAVRVSLVIQMRRYLEPATCGNGTLEPTELCDPPGSPDESVCDATCQTKEVWLSNGRGSATTGTVSGKPGDKERPTLVWPAGKGPAGTFVALFSDKSAASKEITVRVRSDAFGRFSGHGSEVADFSFFLPHDPTASIPPAESAANQSAPAAVAAAGRTWVAFEDDSGGDLDIKLRSMDATFTAEQTGGPIRVNGTGTANEAGSQSLPSIAVNKQGILFIAWQSDDGSIQGRTYAPDTSIRGATRVLSPSGANKNVRLSALGSGFLAVWESGAGVKLARLSPDGTPSDAEQVNGPSHTGPISHPDVTSLADNRFAVVFSDRGDIFIQRYGTDGKAIAGDQDAPVNAVVASGDQYGPVIAPMTAASGSYAVAWLDGASGDVRAAYLGGTSSFLFNPVDGQPGEFLASASPGRRRTNPSITVGGAGPSVAVAWEDTTSDAKAGIYGRRLPLAQ